MSLPRNYCLFTGPCAAESEEQLFEVAHQLKEQQQVDVFRAGVWKPRTRPGAFEGVGEPALRWLQQIQQQLNIPVAIEIAETWHLEQALKHDIRQFWIGARTTVNPLYVQRLAEALKGQKDIIIWVKNPMHPDISLWQGAIERFARADIQRVGAIHRGFYSLHEKYYRNSPLWSIALTLRERLPQIPLLCDVSHIAGQAERLPELIKQAISLNFEGLMVEVHPNPPSALSDASQQITPATLFELLNDLSEESLSPSCALRTLRDCIDSCDEQIIQQLIDRMQYVKQLSLIKKQHNIPLLQEDRWSQVARKYRVNLTNANFPADFCTKLAELIHQASLHIQSQESNNK